MNEIAEWFFDNLGWFLIAFIILIIVAGIMSAKCEAEMQEKFMGECTKDHKEYECTAMWRAGRHSSTTFVPITTVIR